MSHSSEDASGDGADRPHIRITRARLSHPDATNAAVAPHIPGVIRTAAAASSRGSAWGYSPKLSVDMAAAHSWAPYATVVSALRCLSLLSLQVGHRVAVRETVTRMYGHPTPFGAARRFPAGEVYVCLDRPPFARKMQGIQEPLIKAEAEGYGDEFVSACSSYINGIGNALDELTRVRSDVDRGAPVLYDRATFESAFLLAWTEPSDESLVSCKVK
ncbi:unnamed protein product [Alopecurus aequalis]